MTVGYKCAGLVVTAAMLSGCGASNIADADSAAISTASSLEDLQRRLNALDHGGAISVASSPGSSEVQISLHTDARSSDLEEEIRSIALEYFGSVELLVTPLDGQKDVEAD